MSPISGADAYEGMVRELGTLGAYGSAVAARNLPINQESHFSFASQLGAAFRQENVAVALFRASGSSSFGFEPGFNPADHLGPYKAYTDRFPALLTAESPAELAFVKNRIDQEVSDRNQLQNAGFLRSLALYLPAGLVSPENLIPIGGIVRSARFGSALVKGGKGVGTAARTAGKRGLLAAGAEGTLSAAAAELALRPVQGLRTDEESLSTIIASGIFASLIGAAGGAAGATKRKLMKAVFKEETLEKAGAETIVKAMEPGGILSEGTKLGVKFKTALSEFDRFADLGDTAGARSSAAVAKGIMIRAISEDNPALGKMLGADERMGKLIAKTQFFNPGGRLARSPLGTANMFSDVLIKNALREKGMDVAGIEPLLQMMQVRLFQAKAEFRTIYKTHRESLGDISEDQWADMVGFAARRDDVVEDGASFLRGDLEDADPWELLRRDDGSIDPLMQKAVEEGAKFNRDFLDRLRSLAHKSGALTNAQLSKAQQGLIEEMIDDSYLSLLIDRTFASDNVRNFDEAIRRGLTHQREKLRDSGYLDRLIKHRQDRIDRTKDALSRLDEERNPERKKALQNELSHHDLKMKDIVELKEKLFDTTGFHNLAIGIRRGYLGDPAAAFSQQSALRQRVLRIENRFLEGFMISDARVLQSRMIRSMMPDLVLSQRFAKHFNDRDLMGETGAAIEDLKTRLEGMVFENVERTEFERFQDDVEEADVKSQIMNIVDNARLLIDLPAEQIDLTKARLGGQPATVNLKPPTPFDLQQRIYRLGDQRIASQKKHRKKTRAAARLEEELADELELERSLIETHYGGAKHPALAFGRAVRAKALPKELAHLQEVLAPLKTLRKEAEAENLKLQKNATKINVISKAIAEQNRGAEGPGLSLDELTVRSNRFMAFNAEEAGDITTQLDTLTNMEFEFDLAIDRISQRRRQSFNHNRSTGQLKRIMERDANEMVAKGKMTQSEANKALYGRTGDAGDPRAGGTTHDIDTIMARLRFRHGIGDDHWKHVGKAVRDFNFVRAMGGVVISSFPDTAMLIGQVGLYNYALTMGKWMKGDFKLATMTPDGRNHLGALMWAMEDSIGIERAKTNYGVDHEFVAAPPGQSLSRKARLARASDRAVDVYSRLTLINRWNAFHKAIAAQAIQHHIADVATRFKAGKSIKSYELELVKHWVGSEDSLRRIADQVEIHGEKSGRFHYSRSQLWEGDLETALQFEAGVMKAVNDTIITVGAGDLPTFASKHTLGRLLFQFRGFSAAATNRMLIPAVQRFWKFQDPNLAIQMATMWMMGMMVFAGNEYLKGRNPFEPIENRDGQKLASWRRWVAEGLDRSGILGLLTEVNATTERSLGVGLTSLTGSGQLSRFRSRSPLESGLGPGFGALFDLAKLPGRVGGPNGFTAADASFVRRLVPGQNLFYLKAILDVGPNLSNQNFFDDFKPIEQRLLAPFISETK